MHVRASRALRSILSRAAYTKYSENSPLVTSRLPAFGDRFRALVHPVPPGRLSGMLLGRLPGNLPGRLTGMLSRRASGRVLGPECFPEC